MSQAKRPIIGRDVYIASTAYLTGDLVIGDQATIMPFASVRADIAPIRIGSRVNVQDGAVIHTAEATPLLIGDDVGIGHRAVVHCRRIGSRTLIGIGAILLDDCEIGTRSIVGAGALLTPGTVVPAGSVVLGAPGRIVRQVSDDDLKTIDHVVASYLRIGRRHAAGEYPNIALGTTNSSVPGGSPATE